MNEVFLYEAPEVILQGAFFVLVLVAAEVGFRLGRKSEARTPMQTKSPISTVAAAVLGFLALLMGFTMAMAVSRFEVRRQLVLEEANAIGTSLLRTQLLPAPAGTEIADLLHQYVNVRVQYGIAGNDLARIEGLHIQSVRLQTQLWARVAAYAQQDPNPVRVGFLVQSLNQAIDLEAARWMAFQNHVPESVIYINGLVGMLATMLVGYSFGVNGRRNTFSTLLQTLAITLTLAVIIDLDRPRSGFIRASEQPMFDLLHRP